MIAEIGAGLGSLKAALDIAKGLNAVADAVALNDAKIALQGAIIDAQSSLLAAQEAQTANLKRISELEATLAQLNAWESESQRYQLHEFPAGTLAYTLRSDNSTHEPAHHICPACYQDRHKSILQAVAKHSGGEVVDCPRCKLRLTLADFPPMSSTESSDYY